jgi:hypothetical protein
MELLCFFSRIATYFAHEDLTWFLSEESSHSGVIKTTTFKIKIRLAAPSLQMHSSFANASESTVENDNSLIAIITRVSNDTLTELEIANAFLRKISVIELIHLIPSAIFINQTTERNANFISPIY